MERDMKYKATSLLPPRIFEGKDKRYIVPGWIEITADTTIDDIEWIRPVYEEKPKPIKEDKYNTRFDSKTNKYICGCQGFWRAKGNCKHVKLLKGEK
jgi:hypothetical protein